MLSINKSAAVFALLVSLNANQSFAQNENVVPEKAANDLKFLFNKLAIFENKYDKFPQGIIEMREKLGTDNGFGMTEWNRLKISTTDVINPSYAMQEGLVWYIWHKMRPDGSAHNSPAQKGLFDVVCSTPIYDWRPDGSMGKEVILKSDGSVIAVPLDETLICPTSLHKVAFPGQTNVPPLQSMTYSESLDEKSKLIGDKPVVEGNGSRILDNGGPNSLLQITRRLSFPNAFGLDRQKLWQVFSPAQKEFSLDQIQSGASKVNLDTKVERLGLSELMKSGSPALLFFQDDGRVVTLIAIDDDRGVIVDRGFTLNIARNVLQARYSGEALVPARSLAQQAGIVADDAVRALQLPSLEAEVPQQFVLRNIGKASVTLQLEYPLLGVTESKLSKDTLAPGETATLDLKVKWRSIVKAPTQNVLVSLQTNDPIVPRLQLAILLTPPQEAAK